MDNIYAQIAARTGGNIYMSGKAHVTMDENTLVTGGKIDQQAASWCAGGNIYIGVVGPVRTGKSTLIKRMMEELVIPNMDDPYRRERARDELPQSGSGKTIMTAEPKFVPEEAVEITPDGTTRLRIRMIDSVGYMVDGAVGATEDGIPRMVTTPWFDHEIPMTEAAVMRKLWKEKPANMPAKSALQRKLVLRLWQRSGR